METQKSYEYTMQGAFPQSGMLPKMSELQKPTIVNSVTQDEDELDSDDSDGCTEYSCSPMDRSPQRNRATDSIESYLLNYDNMVRQQEKEHDATLSHMHPLLNRLQVLVNVKRLIYNDIENDDMLREFTYAELSTVLKVLEEDPSQEFMTTDRQLLLVLRMLTQAVKIQDQEERITWIEIIQCYKTCIVGMQALEHISEPARTRVRERSLSMMTLFQPAFKEVVRDVAASSVESDAFTGEARKATQKKILVSEHTFTGYVLIVGAFLLGVMLTACISRQAIAEQSQRGFGFGDARAELFMSGRIVSPFHEPSLDCSPFPDAPTGAPVSVQSSLFWSQPKSFAPTPIVMQSQASSSFPPFQRQAEHPFHKHNIPKQASSMIPSTVTTDFLVANEGPFAADGFVLAAVAGGAAIIGLLLPALATSPIVAGILSLIPVGVTVIAATMLAPLIAQWIAKFQKTIHTKRVRGSIILRRE
jgi:hypothetical protein